MPPGRTLNVRSESRISMRRTCKYCAVEYRHEPATARVGGTFFMACSAECLRDALAEVAA